MDPKTQISKRKLSAILFADIVNYTSLMQRDEQNASTLLRHFQKTMEAQVQAHNGRIVNFYGDGALCTFEIPIDAVRCGMLLQSTFQSAPIVPVRIGIHSGTVTMEEEKIFGDSVNIASRIESMGVGGSILLSRKVRNEVKNNPDLQMQSLGSFRFKNVEEPIEIFALTNEGYAVPKRAHLMAKAKVRSPEKKNKLLLIFIAIFLLAIFGIWNYNSSNDAAIAVKGKISGNSLAILPFANMSTDQENQFFTDGIHDDLLTQVSKIGNMKVISRTSVNKYRDTEKTSPEIGEELGVANLLEGSVRRAGNTVRINVQLIKAASDEHLWSEIYDRKLNTNDIFAIQTEIVKAIAVALKTNISLEQQKALAELPTENFEAYEAYLKARQLMEVRNETSLNEAKSLFEKAISLDPQFALAYIHLGSVWTLFAEYAGADPELTDKIAWEYMEKGMEINDNLAEAYTLKGMLTSTIKEDLDESIEAFEKAISINPNYETAYHWYANVVRDLGRDYDRAMEIHKKAVQINPLSPVLLNNLADYYTRNGDFQKALETLQKGIKIEPAYPWFWGQLMNVYVQKGRLDSVVISTVQGVQQNEAHGTYLDHYVSALEYLGMNAEIKDELETLQQINRLDSFTAFYGKKYLAEVEKDFDKALELNEQFTLNSAKRKNDIRIQILFYKRDYKEVVKIFEKQYPNFQKGEQLSPYSFRDHSRFIKYIYSLKQLGQIQEAQSLWSKFRYMLLEAPDGKDELVWYSKYRIGFNIFDHILSGQQEEAIKKVALYFEDDFFINWQYIEIDPIFESLQANPKFILIMNEVKRKIAKQRENARAYLKGKD